MNPNKNNKNDEDNWKAEAETKTEINETEDSENESDDPSIDLSSIPPKPKRPMTAYHIYSQLERNYIIQNHENYVPHIPDSIDENASERPPKYRSIILPKDWFVSGKGEVKKKDRKNHGVISFVELSKTISHSWNNDADHQTKMFCRDLADAQLSRYREEIAAYVEQYGEEALKLQSKGHNNKRKRSKAAASFSQKKKEASSGNDQKKRSSHQPSVQHYEHDNGLKASADSNITNPSDSLISQGSESAPNFELPVPQLPPLGFPVNANIHGIAAPSVPSQERNPSLPNYQATLPFTQLPLQNEMNPDNSPYPLDREVGEYLSRMLNDKVEEEQHRSRSPDSLGTSSINFNTSRSPFANATTTSSTAASTAALDFPVLNRNESSCSRDSDAKMMACAPAKPFASTDNEEATEQEKPSPLGSRDDDDDGPCIFSI